MTDYEVAMLRIMLRVVYLLTCIALRHKPPNSAIESGENLVKIIEQHLREL